MKFKKLFTIIVFFSLATGAGSAFAQDITDCDGFEITGETGGGPGGSALYLEVDSITLDGQSCYISIVRVSGDVEVRNADLVILQNAIVDGDVKMVNNGNVASILQVDAEGDILVRNNDNVRVDRSRARTIRVIGNGEAELIGAVALGINCRNNDILFGDRNISFFGNNCEPQ